MLSERISFISLYIYFTCKVKSTACTLTCFFGSVMTGIVLKVHIASLVEHIFIKTSELELLSPHLSSHFSLSFLMFYFVHYLSLFTTCCCIHCPDFFQAIFSPVLFCFLGWLPLSSSVCQSRLYPVLFKPEF